MNWADFWECFWGLNWVAIAQIAATVVLILTLIFTERRARKEARRADAAADRAENAARGTIDALERIGRGVEELELVALSPGASVRTEVRWTLTHHIGDTYMLTNIGDRAAANVRLEADPTLVFRAEDVAEGTQLGPGEAVTFLAARSMGTRDSTITVKWLDQEGTEHQWRYPLPPRPPRR